MPETQAARRRRAAERIAAADADAALITSPPNVRYLTGLASSNAALLLTVDAAAVLATDSRYTLAARRDCPDVDVRTCQFVEPELARQLAARALRRVCFEAHEMTVERHDRLVAAAEGVTFAAFGREIEDLRQVKDDGEIELLTVACRITGETLAEVLPHVGPGRTERDVAAELDRGMVERGADRPAFDTIVAAGPNGALPHHVPSDRPLAAGDLVTIDFGARYRGYHADMTRTVAVGAPADWQREVHALVAAAQRAGVAAVRAGAAIADVDAAARDVIAAAGHGEHFQHGLGHGVGLEIHEAPIVGRGRRGTLRCDTSVTVEPGVYLPDRGGVRIEDVVVAGDADGSPGSRVLTTAPRDLLVL